ncbi:hypothetical protein JKP88DRAFT_262998 [Tribonema minus]|uniref:Rhodanese domain-containing protein n=1 Tax=Tribonema minus TaxID=303371 RepID=A0A835YXG6_9STRA|nr:hypothetical protein JKP88DRAFT_262998 [Tribonema minus]
MVQEAPGSQPGLAAASPIAAAVKATPALEPQHATQHATQQASAASESSTSTDEPVRSGSFELGVMGAEAEVDVIGGLRRMEGIRRGRVLSAQQEKLRRTACQCCCRGAARDSRDGEDVDIEEIIDRTGCLQNQQLRHLAAVEEAAEAVSSSSGSDAQQSGYQRFCAAAAATTTVLDLRPSEHYAQGHVPGSSSLPLSELGPRLYELPAPFGPPVGLVGNNAQREEARGVLEAGGWTIGEETDVEGGQGMAGVELQVGGESPQVWRPNDFLDFALHKYVLPDIVHGDRRTGLALDLGCGNGRDAVFLAQKLPPGWRVVGVDNHKGALQRCAELASRWSRDGRCFWLCRDLRKNTASSLDDLPADIIHGHRFMDKPLMAAARDRLPVGGFFVWGTFMQLGEEQNLAPPHKPSRMVAHGELHRIFSSGSATYKVLHDEAGELNTRGVPVPANFFVAQRVS